MVTDLGNEISIGYPNNAYKSSLKTAGPPSPTELDNNDILKIQDVLRRGQVIETNINFTPMPSSLNTCFRDAVLAGLLSLQAFVGYFEDVGILDNTIKAPAPLADLMIQMFNNLRDTSVIFWDASIAYRARTVRLTRSVERFWADWTRLHKLTKDAKQEDAPEFLYRLLEILTSTIEAKGLQRDTFYQLFRSEFVGRELYACQCEVKLRQAHNADDGRFIISATLTQTQPKLEDALAWSIYDKQGETTSRCPTCGLDAQRYRYLKFRYLPEVLFVQLDFLKAKNDGECRDLDGRCLLLESFDLDMLQDKIDLNKGQDETDVKERENKQRRLLNTSGGEMNVAYDSIYKLRFVISYCGFTNDTSSFGHYRCQVLTKNKNWISIDTRSNPPVSGTTLESIESDDTFQPRLLAYVRQHAQSSEALPGYSVQPSPAAPEDQSPENQMLAHQPPGNQPHDYSQWDLNRLTTELRARNITLPKKKNEEIYREMLGFSDRNNSAYDIFTAEHLRTLMKQRNLRLATGERQNKKNMATCLRNNDKLHTTNPTTEVTTQLPFSQPKAYAGRSHHTQPDFNALKQIIAEQQQTSSDLKQFLTGFMSQLQKLPATVDRISNNGGVIGAGQAVAPKIQYPVLAITQGAAPAETHTLVPPTQGVEPDPDIIDQSTEPPRLSIGLQESLRPNREILKVYENWIETPPTKMLLISANVKMENTSTGTCTRWHQLHAIPLPAYHAKHWLGATADMEVGHSCPPGKSRVKVTVTMSHQDLTNLSIKKKVEEYTILIPAYIDTNKLVLSLELELVDRKAPLALASFSSSNVTAACGASNDDSGYSGDASSAGRLDGVVADNDAGGSGEGRKRTHLESVTNDPEEVDQTSSKKNKSI